MQRLTPKQLALLIALTLVWGINWPVMKVGVTSYPPLTFRALSILLGVPVLGLAQVVMKVPFRLPRIYWREFAILTITNMMIWHVCIILAVRSLSSGRAAILGYTMPIFSAILGALLFGAVMTWRNWAGVAAAIRWAWRSRSLPRRCGPWAHNCCAAHASNCRRSRSRSG